MLLNTSWVMIKKKKPLDGNEKKMQLHNAIFTVSALKKYIAENRRARVWTFVYRNNGVDEKKKKTTLYMKYCSRSRFVRSILGNNMFTLQVYNKGIKRSLARFTRPHTSNEVGKQNHNKYNFIGIQPYIYIYIFRWTDRKNSRVL